MGRSTGCACSRTASVSTGADEGRGLLDHDAKATYRPSIETSAEKLSALPTFSFELTLTSSVVPFSRSRTITSKTPFSSPGTTSGPSVAPAGYHRLRALRQPGTWTGVPGASSPRVHRAGFQALPGAGRGRERIGRLIRSQAASSNPPRTTSGVYEVRHGPPTQQTDASLTLAPAGSVATYRGRPRDNAGQRKTLTLVQNPTGALTWALACSPNGI
jgi:hypothetical protein